VGMMDKALLVVALLMLCSCTGVRQLSLYPVGGPIFDAGHLQPLAGTLTNAYADIGKGSVTLPDGRTCDGEWSMVSNTMTANSSLVVGDAWGSLYGDSLGVVTGGQQPGMATLICPDNNVLQIAFLAGGSGGHGIGVGEDTVGNRYKVHF